MEWARRIVVSRGNLLAECESVGGRVSLLDLTELASRGTPSARVVARRKLAVRFEDFIPCDGGEYFAHFGREVHAGTVDQHQVFELVADGTRYLVPALVLMRALFRPTAWLLPRMFRPSVLEQVCTLHFNGSTFEVEVNRRWSTAAASERRSDCEAALGWMMVHPTARRMADSVHQHAMAGRIAVEMPQASAEVVLAGVQDVSAVLVTEARILSVNPMESPDFPVDERVGRIDYINRKWAEGRTLGDPVSADVPLNADGELALTDSEWAVVGPMLEGARKRKREYQHCQRALFDGILGKLATGKSWRDAQYTVGDWRNAATTHRRWTSRGVFTEALQALREMR
jgi:transposase